LVAFIAPASATSRNALIEGMRRSKERIDISSMEWLAARQFWH
jgi:hypothetical protein